MDVAQPGPGALLFSAEMPRLVLRDAPPTATPPPSGPRGPAPGSPRAAAERTAILALLLLGCGQGTPAEAPRAPTDPAPASNAALLVDDLPLAPDEPSALSRDILELYPEYSRVHALRLALTNEFLPRLAVRARNEEGWERARAACAAAGGEGEALDPHVKEGNFRILGVGLWSAARHLPLQVWSDPIELAARWVRVRPEAKAESADPREEVLTLSVVEFPVLPADLSGEEEQARIEAAIDASRLTLLDPLFAESVPEAWKHRMRGTKP